MNDPYTMAKMFENENKNKNKTYLSQSLLNEHENNLGNVQVIINSTNSDMSISKCSAELVFPNETNEKYDFGLSINIIKSVLGMGILGISYTLKESGYLYIIVMLILSCITGYNATNIAKFVKEFKYTEKYEEQHLTYFNISEEIFGYKMKILTQIVWSIEISCCCIMIINLSFTFLKELFDLNDSFKLLGSIIVFYYLLTFIKKYDNIKFLSFLGISSIFALFAFLFYHLIFDFVNDDLPVRNYKALDYKTIPRSIAITLFSFGGHIVFPEIFSSTKNMKKLKKNLIITWSIFSTFVYCLIATSFILFGDSVSVDIINNLDQSYWFKKIITLLLLINIIFTFPLMFTPLNLKIISGVKTLNINEKFKIFLYKYFVRFCLIVIICIIGNYWKSYLDIMNIVGGFLENTTSIILPAMLSLKHLKLNLFEKTCNILIFEFGIILLICTFVQIFI
jgi:vesicular inhibitory amino acid transporter